MCGTAVCCSNTDLNVDQYDLANLPKTVPADGKVFELIKRDLSGLLVASYGPVVGGGERCQIGLRWPAIRDRHDTTKRDCASSCGT